MDPILVRIGRMIGRTVAACHGQIPEALADRLFDPTTEVPNVLICQRWARLINKLHQDNYRTLTDQQKRSALESCVYIAVAMKLEPFLRMVGINQNWDELSPNFDNLRPCQIEPKLEPMFPVIFRGDQH